MSEAWQNGKKQRTWRGFEDQEAANPIFATLENLGATDIVSANFLNSEGQEGYILQLIVRKSRRIILATNGDPYRRSNAQSIAVSGADAVRRLELDNTILH